MTLRSLLSRTSTVTVLSILIATVTTQALADSLDDQARRIGKMLQCPVCSGVSIAESPSDLAHEMMKVVRSKLEQGETEEQIVQYFVERYGEGVLREPPRRGTALLVWSLPPLILVLGTIVLYTVLRSWNRRTSLAAILNGHATRSVGRPSKTTTALSTGESRPTDEYVLLVEQELEAYRQEVGR